MTKYSMWRINQPSTHIMCRFNRFLLSTTVGVDKMLHVESQSTKHPHHVQIWQIPSKYHSWGWQNAPRESINPAPRTCADLTDSSTKILDKNAPWERKSLHQDNIDEAILTIYSIHFCVCLSEENSRVVQELHDERIPPLHEVAVGVAVVVVADSPANLLENSETMSFTEE